MENPVYSEKQAMPFRWLVAVIGVGIMLFGAAQTAREQPVEAAVMVLVAGLFVLVLWGFTVFSVIVTPTELRFGFPLYRKRFALNSIEVGDVERIGFMAGIGVHFWNRKWVFNGRLGRGVNIRHGRLTYVIGSNQPEHLQSMLLQFAHSTAVRA